MLLILTFGLLTRLCLASDFWVSKWSETPVGPDGPWHALNISWDNPLQAFAMLPSLTKNSLLIAADACSRQDSFCPDQVQTGDWPMWTSSAAHEPFLVMDSKLFGGQSWDETVSQPLNLSGDGQWIHERGAILDINDEIAYLDAQSVTLTHNFTVNSPAGQPYTMNVGFFSLYGAEASNSWLNATGFNMTQDLQLATAKNISKIASVSYGLQVGSPTLGIDPSLVLGGYDRSLCLTEPITTQNRTFALTDISVGSDGAAWPFLVAYTANSNASANFQGGLLGHDTPLQVLANPGVPYLYLPHDACDSIAKYLPVTYDQGLGLYLWNTKSDTRHYNEITTTFAYLSFTFSGGTTQQDQQIHVPFSLLDLELDSPLTTSRTRYFPCRPFTPDENQPYHLGRAFLQAALLAQNWETNTTWLSQAPGPKTTGPSKPVTIEETDTAITEMFNAPFWLSTWNGTLKASNWTQGDGSNSTSPSTPSSSSSSSSSSSLSSGAIAGIAIGAVAGLALVAAALFFHLRHRRSKAGYGDVALISFDSSDNSQPPASSTHERKTSTEAASTPVFEVESTEKQKQEMSELSSEDAKKAAVPVEVDGMGIAELPGH